MKQKNYDDSNHNNDDDDNLENYFHSVCLSA